MTTLTIRRKAWRSRKRYRKSRLQKYRRGWRRLLVEHFVARLLDSVTWRSPAIPFSAVQNSSSRLTLVLWPARTTERLTTSDFIMVPASCVGTMVPRREHI
jgi:hypothetical protein